MDSVPPVEVLAEVLPPLGAPESFWGVPASTDVRPPVAAFFVGSLSLPHAVVKVAVNTAASRTLESILNVMFMSNFHLSYSVDSEALRNQEEIRMPPEPLE